MRWSRSGRPGEAAWPVIMPRQSVSPPRTCGRTHEHFILRAPRGFNLHGWSCRQAHRGWTGSVQTLRRYVRAFRATTVKAPMAPAPPKPRRVVRWIMSNPDNLGDEDKAQLKQILARCPELDAVAQHVRDFAATMRDLSGDRLDDWIRRVQNDDLPALHSFVTGVKRDHDAVINGLTMSWNSGPVEGAVTRIKLLKRMGYGRANLDLLRRRVLYGT
jgi:transposase